MKKGRTYVVCDECKGEERTNALVTCEVHSVDLCEFHIGTHFDGTACRLVPTDRELTGIEKLEEQIWARIYLPRPLKRIKMIGAGVRDDHSSQRLHSQYRVRVART